MITDYYTTDELAMPYSWYRNKGSAGYIFMLLKALGWKFPSINGRRPAIQLEHLSVPDLPSSLQKSFTEKNQIANDYNYSLFGIFKYDTIGYLSQYTSTLIDSKNISTWNIGAVLVQSGSVRGENWSNHFRSDFLDGTTIITLSAEQAATHLLKPHVKFELLPEDAPISQVFSRHQERISQKGRENAVRIPEKNRDEFFLQRAQKEFQDVLESGYFRKLSPQEVARLKSITCDFE